MLRHHQAAIGYDDSLRIDRCLGERYTDVECRTREFDYYCVKGDSTRHVQSLISRRCSEGWLHVVPKRIPDVPHFTSVVGYCGWGPLSG